ncbi:MAG: hypothetical protein VYD19_09545 [Myxococcota bacterium]|nr:hypothetical protein [Myxococcota bacterium]
MLMRSHELWSPNHNSKAGDMIKKTNLLTSLICAVGLLSTLFVAQASADAQVSAVSLELGADAAVENELAFIRAQLEAGKQRLPRRIDLAVQAKALLRIAAAAGPAKVCASALAMLPRRWGEGRRRQAIDSNYKKLIQARAAKGQPAVVRAAALLAAAPQLRKGAKASLINLFEAAFQESSVVLKLAVLQGFARNQGVAGGRAGALASRLLKPFVAALAIEGESPVKLAALRLLSQSRKLHAHAEKAALGERVVALSKSGSALQRALALQTFKPLFQNLSNPQKRVIIEAAAAESEGILRASALNLIGHYKIIDQLSLLKAGLDDTRKTKGEIKVADAESAKLFNSLRRVKLGVGATVQITVIRALKGITKGWKQPYVPQGYAGRNAKEKLAQSLSTARQWFSAYETDASAVH